jgi:precorrin-8X/cobalt-precorrin-8 methylmutase
MMPLEYLRDPEAIYAKSFATIRTETDMSNIPASARPIAERIVHACGMPEIAGDLRISADFAESAASALRASSATSVCHAAPRAPPRLSIYGSPISPARLS